MKSITLFTRNFSLFSNALKQLPPSYNPNISLISNIGKTKQIGELLIIHESLSSKFTEKHLAQAARKIPLLIKAYRFSSKYINQKILQKQHEPYFNTFLTRLNSMDTTRISIQCNKCQYIEFLNFTVFLQKIVKFKKHFMSSQQQISSIQSSFKQNLVKYFEACQLQKFNFLQACSLLNSFSIHLSSSQLIRLLGHISKLLSEKQPCSCFHLTILCQMINQINNPCPQFIQLKSSIEQVCYEEVKLQLEVTKHYLTCRFLIQIYNGFYPSKQDSINYLLPLILGQMKINPKDETVFNKFFQKDLNTFRKALAETTSNQIVQQVETIIQMGMNKQQIRLQRLGLSLPSGQNVKVSKVSHNGLFKKKQINK